MVWTLLISDIPTFLFMKTVGQFVIRTENFVDSKICGICEKTVYKHASIRLIESDDEFHWKMH